MADNKNAFSTPKGQVALGMAGVQILSGFLQAEMVKRQARTQAEIAEYNAQLAEYDAWKTEAYGATLMAQSQNQIDQARGTSKVFAGSLGIKNEGSLAEIQAQNELNSLVNKVSITNRVNEQAMGYKRQASQLRLGASLTGLQANVQSSSIFMGSIAQASGNIATQYVGNEKITKEDLNLPTEKSPSGYSAMSTSDYSLNDNRSPRLLGLSLMPGGY